MARGRMKYATLLSREARHLAYQIIVEALIETGRNPKDYKRNHIANAAKAFLQEPEAKEVWDMAGRNVKRTLTIKRRMEEHHAK